MQHTFEAYDAYSNMYPCTVEVDDPAIFGCGLPKWPACLITGVDVSEVQAAQVIFRTDHNFPFFHFATNDCKRAKTYSDVFGIPEEPNSISMNWWPSKEALRRQCKVIDIEYLHTDAIMSSYVGGPGGWMSWDGKIQQDSRNIGKYPSIECVAAEWACIAEAFPFLDLSCQLLSGETCEDDTSLIVEFEIKDGAVSVRTPDRGEHPMVPVCDSTNTDVRKLMLGLRSEFGLSLATFERKVKMVYGDIPQFEVVEPESEE